MTVTYQPPATIAGPTSMGQTTTASARPTAATKSESKVAAHSRVAPLALAGVRLAIGFEFFWAFLDKTFGLGYATPAAKAWINGGSPTKGFLSGAIGPLQGVFQSLAGVTVIDWLFMMGLFGVGVALILGVALRPAALFGSVMLLLMFTAVWLPTTVAGGQPTGSTNPLIDEHIINTFALIVVAALATPGTGFLGRKWASLPIVNKSWWLR